MLHSIRRALTIRTLWHLSHVSISFQSKVMPKKKRVLALWRHHLTGSWYLICNYLQKKIKLFQTGKMRRIAWYMSLRCTLVQSLLFFYMCDSVLRSRWFHWTDSFCGVVTWLLLMYCMFLWMESVADIVRIPVVLFLWHWLNEFRWNLKDNFPHKIC